MGGDGGSIPRREELVRQRQRPEQRDRNADNAAKWRHCSISQTKLERPIVACELGRLYSKVAVLQLLLDKEKARESGFAHIRRLKDICELVLTPNPAHDPNSQTSAEYICPVTSLEMNGHHRFCFIWTCGCVLSDRAMKEIRDSACLKCCKAFSPDDVIVLNPNAEELSELRKKRDTRAQKLKASKDDKKRKAAATKESASSAAPASTSASAPSAALSGPPKKKVKTATAAASSAATASSSSSSSAAAPRPATAKKRSIQDDPNASATYKSLFTTSAEAKRQAKAHWVTYNPMYFH